MRKFFGVMMIVLGIVGGLWVGVWWGFVGGIVQFIHGVNPVNAGDIAWGIARVFILSQLSGWVICVVGVGFGRALLERR